MAADAEPVIDAVWFKSSYSGGNATECVECAYTGDDTLVRDSKRADGHVVLVGTETWRAFIGGLKENTLGDAA